tara:strand:+ start:416 stop:5182 length:4767 start_codon:yes stop_codon:yes gene_type:complete
MAIPSNKTFVKDLQNPTATLKCIVGIGNAQFIGNTWYLDKDSFWISTSALTSMPIFLTTGIGSIAEPINDLPNNIGLFSMNVDPLLESTPRTYESVDLMSKKFRSSTISLDLINNEYKGFRMSNWVKDNPIIGKKVLIYWITQSGLSASHIRVNKNAFKGNRIDTNIETSFKPQERNFTKILQNSSLLMAALDIKEFKHSKTTASIILEDKTQEILTNQIPDPSPIPEGYLVPNTSAYQQQSRNKLSPIVYGKKEKVKVIVDDQFNLRAEKWWDENNVIGGVGVDDILAVPQYYNDANGGYLGEFIYALNSGVYTLIPMFAAPNTNDDTPSDVVDMTGTKQFRWNLEDAYGAFQLYAHVPAVAEQQIEFGNINVDQYQQLSSGVYQAIPRLEQTSVVQKDSTDIWDDFIYREFRTDLFGQYGFTPFGDDTASLSPTLKQTYKTDVYINYNKFYTERSLELETTGTFSTTLEKFAVDSGTGPSSDAGTIYPRRVHNRGYSFIIPLLSYEDGMDAATVRFAVLVTKLSNINFTNYFTNPNNIDPANLTTDTNCVNHTVTATDEFLDENQGWLLKFMCRGVNVGNHADYEGLDILQGGQGFPEFSGHWATHYMNLNLASMSFVGSGENPHWTANNQFGISDFGFSQFGEYEGNLSAVVSFELPYWQVKAWSGLEVQIMPSHWCNGWKFDNVNFHSDDYDQLTGNSYIFENPLTFSADIDVKIKNIEFSAVGSISGTPNKQLYMPVYGRKKSGNYITSPLEIVHDLYQNEALKEPSDTALQQYVDGKSYGYVKNKMLEHGSYNLAFSLSTSKKAKDLFADILKDTPLYLTYGSNGLLKYGILEDVYDYPDMRVKLTAQDIHKISFSQTRIEDVILNINVAYDYDEGTKVYTKNTGFRDVNEVLDADFDKFYGITTRDKYTVNYQTKYITDPTTAFRLRDRLLMMHCNQHTLLKLRLTMQYLYLEIGDIVALEDMKCLEGVKPYGEDVTYKAVIDNGQTIIRNGQEIYPFFIITKIKKSSRGVDIECMQLHNLALEQDQYEFSGCTDPNAINYDENAIVDNGTCEYFLTGCTDPNATNYDADANIDNGSCVYLENTTGCTDPAAMNFNPVATEDDGSCQYFNNNAIGTSDNFVDDIIHVHGEQFGAMKIDLGTTVPIYPFYNVSGEQSVGWSDFDYLSNLLLNPDTIDLKILEHYVLDGNWDRALDSYDLVNLGFYAALTDLDGVDDYVAYIYVVMDTLEVRGDHLVSMDLASTWFISNDGILSNFIDIYDARDRWKDGPTAIIANDALGVDSPNSNVGTHYPFIQAAWQDTVSPIDGQYDVTDPDNYWANPYTNVWGRFSKFIVRLSFRYRCKLYFWKNSSINEGFGEWVWMGSDECESLWDHYKPLEVKDQASAFSEYGTMPSKPQMWEIIETAAPEDDGTPRGGYGPSYKQMAEGEGFENRIALGKNGIALNGQDRDYSIVGFENMLYTLFALRHSHMLFATQNIGGTIFRSISTRSNNFDPYAETTYVYAKCKISITSPDEAGQMDRYFFYGFDLRHFDVGYTTFWNGFARWAGTGYELDDDSIIDEIDDIEAPDEGTNPSGSGVVGGD